MQKDDFLQIAERLLRCPAAPYFESGVAAEVLKICSESGLHSDYDRYGNLIVSLKTAPRLRPVCLVAHMDHPGFRIDQQIRPGVWEASFHGGVPESYFQPGTPVRLMPGATKARLTLRKGEICTLESNRERSENPTFAVWDLVDFALRGETIHARACDDLIGVATILTVLSRLKARKAKVNVAGLLTRAEEVGFHGTLAAISTAVVPKNAFVISLETSREMAPVQMGKGVIIRVGDKASIFDSQGSRYLNELGTDLARTNSGFAFQRALMSGGTCEGTPFYEAGYQTAAVCIALGNYHNCADGNRIAAEFVNVNDALSMAALLEEGVVQMKNWKVFTGRLGGRLKKLAAEAKKSLRRSQMGG